MDRFILLRSSSYYNQPFPLMAGWVAKEDSVKQTSSAKEMASAMILYWVFTTIPPFEESEGSDIQKWINREVSHSLH